MKLSRIFQYLFVAATTLVITYLYWRYQTQIIAGDGKGWDGHAYYQIYNYFAGLPYSVTNTYPFCKRVGLPFLAALLPANADNSFLYINLLAGVLAILVCFTALRNRFSFVIALVATAPLIFYLFSPIRFPNFYPYTVDPPAIFLYAACLLALVNKKYLFAVLLLLTSAIFRESGIYFATLLPLILVFSKEISLKQTLLFYTLIIVTVFLLKFTNFGPCDGNQLRTVIGSAYYKFRSFFGVLKIVAGLSLTLAPFFLIRSKLLLQQYDVLALISISFLILSILMGVFGGSDTTRIFYIAYPLYVPYLARLIEDQPRTKIVFYSSAGLIANSFAQKIPEPENYQPNNDIVGLFSLFPDHGHIAVATGIIVFWIACVAIARSINWERLDITLKLKFKHHLTR